MSDHIHKLQFVERGGVKCETLGCNVYYSEEHILQILDCLANEGNALNACPRCEGTGEYKRLGVPSKKCAVCNGTGRIGV